MLTAQKILKAIFPQTSKDTATGSFGEWLSFNCESGELITPDTLNLFFQECLEYPHWQQNKKILGNELRYFLEALCTHQDEVFDFNDVIWPTQMQLIEIENNKTWAEVISCYLKDKYTVNEKFRILFDEPNTKVIAVTLKNNGQLSVRQFNRKFFIRKGALVPLREDLELLYDDELNLLRETYHKIEIAPYTTARFHLEEQGLYGSAVRGYLFQKSQVFSASSIELRPRLFFAIKRLEQHFIKRDSDPYYQETVTAVEHGIRLLKLNDEAAQQNAPDLLSQAQNALENVFIGDKLLALLIRDLQYTMAATQAVSTSTRATKATKPSEAQRAAQTTAVKQKEERLWFQPQLKLDLINSSPTAGSSRAGKPTNSSPTDASL